jgi:hypothetical protein
MYLRELWRGCMMIMIRSTGRGAALVKTAMRLGVPFKKGNFFITFITGRFSRNRMLRGVIYGYIL